jgi:hypothetical protein
MSELAGYTLELRCRACGLRRRVEGLATTAAPAVGDTLGAAHIGILERGCGRCGVWRFEVLNAPEYTRPAQPDLPWDKKIWP